jgi:rhamnulokinase
MTRSFLAFDLGAESGRTIYGNLQDQILQLKQISRFPNGMIQVGDHWHWNTPRLFDGMKQGMRLCAQEGLAPGTIGIDTWGVDFSLLDGDGSLLGLPFAYRDYSAGKAMREFFEHIPRERIYELTGIQFLPFNSLYQLYALGRREPALLDATRDLLFIPDLFTYLLTGEKTTEFTFATTSQVFNPLKSDWEEELMTVLGISSDLLQPVVAPGTTIGHVQAAISRETGLAELPVVAVASHDTGSAVAAVPAEGEDWAYISSGTWSLMGIETRKPLINNLALALNFTNEGGVGGTFRFLKNICGLWLLQACRKMWDELGSIAYADLISEAETAPAFLCLVDPDDPGFLNPSDMPRAIQDFCKRSGQAVPESIPQYVRCILESLALKYRFVLDQLRQVSTRPIRRIHVIGGGSQNRLLNQYTANATGLEVVAGPVEATAIGNILVQAFSQEDEVSLVRVRRIVQNSFPLTRYLPQETEDWERVYQRFCSILGKPGSEVSGVLT